MLTPGGGSFPTRSQTMDNLAVNTYNSLQSLAAKAYEVPAEKAQILTDIGGLVVGTGVGAALVKEGAEKTFDIAKEIPAKFMEHFDNGDYFAAGAEGAGRAFGAIIAGGFTIVIAGATAANAEAAVRSLIGKQRA